MCMNPKVSIVIPVYNGEDYIREAIDSALSQTYENCEVIVVNDGSTDNTEAIVNTYGNKIRYFSKENGGVSSALNVGIDHMEGEYFQYLPHNDLLHPDKIEKNIQAIQKSGNEMSIVWSGWNFKYMDGRGLQPFQIPYQYNDKNRLTNSAFPLLFSLLNLSTVLINKKYFDKVGKFNTKLYTSQDYDMGFRIFLDQRTVYLDDALIDYRIHGQQDSQTDIDFIKNCISISEFMVSNLSEAQILNMFGCKYRFFYYMFDFYKRQGWIACCKNLYRHFQSCSEPEYGVADRKNLYQYLSMFGYNGSNIVLYCAGKNAKSLLSELKIRNISVQALCDNDKKKVGTIIYGIICIHPEEIDPKNDLVIVTKDNPEDMIPDLQKKGIEHIVSYKEIGSTVYHTLPSKQMYENIEIE